MGFLDADDFYESFRLKKNISFADDISSYEYYDLLVKITNMALEVMDIVVIAETFAFNKFRTYFQEWLSWRFLFVHCNVKETKRIERLICRFNRSEKKLEHNMDLEGYISYHQAKITFDPLDSWIIIDYDSDSKELFSRILDQEIKKHV